MIDYTTQPLLFASANRRKVLADFQGGDLTSDGGLPLLREVDRKIGLIDALDADGKVRSRRKLAARGRRRQVRADDARKAQGGQPVLP